MSKCKRGKEQPLSSASFIGYAGLLKIAQVSLIAESKENQH